jgi:N-acetylmuramoyl-L-alanine amidase
VQSFLSPNFDDRSGVGVDMLILHYTGMENGQAALEWLCNPDSKVSSHYIVMEDGLVHQLVDEQHRAWHAGVSSWRGDSRINARSIGIEIVNPGHEFGYVPFPDKQIDAVIELCGQIVSRHAISARHVLAHSDVAPLRKQDPGELFPWARLHEAGLGHYVEPVPLKGGRFFSKGDEGQPVEALQSMLAWYGYGVDVSGVFDENTEAVVKAFQRHFRPLRVDGVADVSTIETLYRLLQGVS